jgi:hypothetical protein
LALAFYHGNVEMRIGFRKVSSKTFVSTGKNALKASWMTPLSLYCYDKCDHYQYNLPLICDKYDLLTKEECNVGNLDELNKEWRKELRADGFLALPTCSEKRDQSDCLDKFQT